MSSQSVSIEYQQGKPAWRIQDENPETFLTVDYEIQFKIFPFPQGALVSCLLMLYDKVDHPYFLHRVYDISDPIALNYLTKIVQYGEVVLLLEKISDNQVPGLDSREIHERTITIDKALLQAVLEEGKEYNQANPDLYGLEALELFVQEFQELRSQHPLPEIWDRIYQKFCFPGAGSKEESQKKKSGGADLPPASSLGPEEGAKGVSSRRGDGSKANLDSLGTGGLGALKGGAPPGVGSAAGPSGGAKGLGSGMPSYGGGGSLKRSGMIGSSDQPSLPPVAPPALTSTPTPAPVSSHQGKSNRMSRDLFGAAPSSGLNAADSSGSLPSRTERKPSEEQTLSRQSTVRYFDRMYPFHTYPLRVVISRGKIKEISVAGVSQAAGDQPFTISAENPYVTIVPIFPGALVIPERVDVDVTPQLIETEFWVTPQTEGDLKGARVELHYQGRVLDKISTPYKVTKHTLAKISIFLSIGFPLLGPFLRKYHMDLESQMESGFPLFKPLFAAVEGTPGLASFAIFGALAGLLYWWKKPKEADPITQFISIDAALEEGASMADPSKTEKMTKKEADQIHDRGIDHLQSGEIDEAIQCFEKVLLIYRKMQISYDYGILLCNMGVAYLDKEEYDKALLTYAEEIGVWTRLDSEKERGRCLSNLGVLYQSLQNYERAAIFFREAIEIRGQSGDREGEIYSAKLLARVYRDLGKWVEARQVYNDLSELLKGDPEQYAGIVQLRGVTAASAKNYNEALIDYSEALQLFQTLGYRREQADLLFNMGLAYQSQENNERALHYFKLALDVSHQAIEAGEKVPPEELKEVEEFIRKLEDV